MYHTKLKALIKGKIRPWVCGNPVLSMLFFCKCKNILKYKVYFLKKLSPHKIRNTKTKNFICLHRTLWPTQKKLSEEFQFNIDKILNKASSFKGGTMWIMWASNEICNIMIFLLLLFEVPKEKNDCRYSGGFFFPKASRNMEKELVKKNPAYDYSEYQAQNHRPLFLPS